MNAAAIIVAAGKGSRFGSTTPKQFLPLGSKPVWKWSYDVFVRHPHVSEIVLVVPKDTGNLDVPEGIRQVFGGTTRTESVLKGLEALHSDPNRPVLIHDGARPGLTADIIYTLINALNNADGAAPALPVIDALKRNGQTLHTVDREGLFRVQTPQIFRYHDILNALKKSKTSLVDDLSAIEAVGASITLVQGSERLAKITHTGDLGWMKQVLLGNDIRTGSGFDVHAFEPGSFVTLCGVNIPYTAKLKGHSDADAPWHALTDALLGALALGDIGDHFPPSDPKWKGAPSSVFLKHAAKLCAEHDYRINNVDLTIICEAPKIKPHREALRRSTATCLGISIDRISVKATTTEGLGFTGREEGIAAHANISLAGSTR